MYALVKVLLEPLKNVNDNEFVMKTLHPVKGNLT